MFFSSLCELFRSFIVLRDTMAQNVLFIRLEDKKGAYKFPIADANMSHDLIDLAAELCKTGRLRTLKVDPSDVEFFGDYDRTQYDGDDDGDGGSGNGDGDDGDPLRGVIQLQHLRTTAKGNEKEYHK